ncbi:MAG TPA: hypothetical protein DCX53_03845 [Anaerolineae bacterium]|nr:hypothetical protein [Anaerolineae bacterium]
MTLSEFLTRLTSFSFSFLAILTVINWLRHRDRAHLDIALAFVSLGLSSIIQIFQQVSGLTAPWLNMIGTLAIVAQPYLLLRVVEYFRSVSAFMKHLGLAGLLLSWVILVSDATPLEIYNTLIIVGYFSIIEFYASFELIRGARSTVGVIQSRLTLAALGSGTLTLVILLAGISAVVPSLSSIITPLNQTLAIITVLLYFFGIATPNWLLRAWRLSEMDRFLQDISNQATEQRLRTVLEHLCKAASRAIEGISLATTWDENQGAFIVRASSDAGLGLENLTITTLNKNHIELMQKPAYGRTSAEVGLETHQFVQLPIQFFLTVPIRTLEQVQGLLVVLLKRKPLFVDDDVKLLSLFTQQSALIMEVEILVNELQNINQTLEKRVEDRTTEIVKLATIVDSANEGILGKTLQGQIASWNGGAERLYGYTAAEVIGKPVSIIVPEDRRAEIEEVYERVKRGEQVAPFETMRVRKDGQSIDVSLTISPIRNARGEIVGISGIEHDITDRKRAETALQIYAEKLEQSNRDLQEFAYVASHDLQEPLRKVLAFGDRLANKYADVLDDTGKDYLLRMQNASQRMQVLIGDLLSLSRVSTRAQPFTKVDLNVIIREVLSNLENIMERTGARVEISNLPTIQADSTQMHQLLQNLIGNALKFQKNGNPPRIKVSAEIEKDFCRISVADNGIGFDIQYLDRIFKPFQRLHNRDEFEGSGMGLAICRRIVERHEGNITATSRPGEGTTFLVTLSNRNPNGGSST